MLCLSPNLTPSQSHTHSRMLFVGEDIHSYAHVHLANRNHNRVKPYARNAGTSIPTQVPSKTGCTLAGRFQKVGNQPPKAFAIRINRENSGLSGMSRHESLSSANQLERAGVVFPELPDFPKGLSVLFVEEDTPNVSENTAFLRGYGYEVTCSESGQTALDLLKRASCCFHVVLAGPAAADHLVHGEVMMSHQIPILLMSSETGLSTVAKSVMCGCIGFICDPIVEDDCDEIWERILVEKLASKKRGLSERGEELSMLEVANRMQMANRMQVET
eukprot:CAMPEP_0198228864 /NCGR_PEP_ID=MMETSP1445-20131203/113825_1 /TAXON_ID=36898 /ORGANISM="Pyramimonas sp., Strain CCMP2087" /LENGTH=273 /DNA_ID=CAMNT_0043909297 /DNA_START=150 /DNA_END=971 /DNA_ORIENTATION=+